MTQNVKKILKREGYRRQYQKPLKIISREKDWAVIKELVMSAQLESQIAIKPS